MHADRARGLTVRDIAKRYQLAPSVTHRLVRHVPIVLPNRWHLARLPQEGPLPVLPLAHRYRTPPVGTSIAQCEKGNSTRPEGAVEEVSDWVNQVMGLS